MSLALHSSGTAILLLGALTACQPRGDIPVSAVPYLGQEPPGAAAEVFAPGLVSTEANEILFGFFDDGAVLFFERTPVDSEDDWIHAPVYQSRIKDGIWTTPVRAVVTGRPWFNEYPDAPEGMVVHFPWRKNLDGSGPSRDIDIWRSVKGPEGWAVPERLGEPVNTEAFDSWPSLAGNGALYFFSNREGGLGGLDLYRAAPGNDSEVVVENLGNVINTEHHDHDPFIAPDESYIVWCSDRPGGYGENDLFVSFRRPDGGWTAPRNLGGDVNTAADDTRPTVTADGRFLFFVSDVSGNRNIHWVDSTVIEALRPVDPEDLVGDLLGQPVPGSSPVPFAPGLVTTEHSDGCVGFGLDGNLFVYQRYENRVSSIFEMVRRGERWERPVKLPFSESHQVGDFTLAADGRTMYFQSNIPVASIGPDAEGGNIWMAMRNDDGWTEPVILGPEINSKWHDSYPLAAPDGTLYFFSRRPGGIGMSDLYVSHRVDGGFADAENLGPVLNTEAHEWDPFVSPEQDVMIFCSTKDGGLGEDDLYVSFRNDAGGWSEPVNMGAPINSSGSENRPWITPDGRYFFFTSTRPGAGRRDVYWMDAAVIEDYRD